MANYFSPRFRDLVAMQAACYQEAVNGCKAGERAKLILAWIAAERLKREMRGIPPLKAIAAPWPMRKARARQLPEHATEIEIVAKESLESEAVTAPPPPSAPSAPLMSLVPTPSQSPISPVNPKSTVGNPSVPAGEEKYPWKRLDRATKARYLANKALKDIHGGNSQIEV